MKAVAVPYVIALILGIAVLGLVGIWFVTSGGKFTKQSTETECYNLIVQYCTQLVGGASLPAVTSEMSAVCSKTSITQPTSAASPVDECRTKWLK